MSNSQLVAQKGSKYLDEIFCKAHRRTTVIESLASPTSYHLKI